MPPRSEEQQELRVQKEWGLTGPQWRSLPLDDRAQIMAYELAETTLSAYREEWKEERRKKKEKGVNPYDLMKAQMGL